MQPTNAVKRGCVNVLMDELRRSPARGQPLETSEMVPAPVTARGPRGSTTPSSTMAVSILYPSITIRLRGSPRQLFRPNGTQTEAERTPNDSEWIPNAPRTIPNGSRMDPERIPNGAGTDPKRAPNGSQTDPERIPNEPMIPRGNAGQIIQVAICDPNTFLSKS